MNNWKVFTNGIWHENPIFRMLLSMCPTLAVTTAAINGVGMGLAVTAVVVISNLLVSLLRGFIPQQVRIPSYIIIIAGVSTVVERALLAYLPALHAALGIFLPLIVVNCVVFMRAESFAAKNPPLSAMLDGLGMGLGFALALTLLASLRELIGAGTWFGFVVFGEGFQPAAMALLPPGGFILLGLLMMALRGLSKQKGRA